MLLAVNGINFRIDGVHRHGWCSLQQNATTNGTAQKDSRIELNDAEL